MDIAEPLGSSDRAVRSTRPLLVDAGCTRPSLSSLERTAIVRATSAASLCDPGEVLSGRWRWVDRFERGAIQFFVAREEHRGRRGLSGRERAVLAGAAEGLSNKEIAFAIGVAPSTVSSHLVRGLRRLGIDDFATLAELHGSGRDVRSVRVASRVFLVVRRPLERRLGFAGLLTDAENGVAELATAGLSNLEIARLRNTSVRTVANQMASIFRKLRIGSRRALSIRCSLVAGTTESGVRCANLATDPRRQALRFRSRSAR
jgi:DNA-binding NarL/FixJ family response regulator